MLSGWKAFAVLLMAALVASCGSVTRADETDAASAGRDGGATVDSGDGSGGPDASVGGDHDAALDCAQCAYGCATSGASCADLAPANGLGPALNEASSQDSLSVATDVTLTFDTDAGAFTCNPETACDTDIGHFTTVGQESPPEIGVFAFEQVEIEEGATVTARGTRALAIVADGEVVIDGTIDARPVPLEPGDPERGVGSLPTDATTNGVNPDNDVVGVTTGSGGGGGVGGNGARGGAAQTDEGASFAGSPGGSQVGTDDLTPLVGGRAGGLSEGGSGCGGFVGGGGGAVQIVSRTAIQVGTSGILNAGGGGGSGGHCGGPEVGGGGGGGAILLESAVIQLDGVLAANGGGGGSRHTQNGEDALSGSAPAQGAPEDGDAPPGGNGAARTTPPTSGGDADADGFSGGGGGGGIGAIRVNTTDGEGVVTGSGLVSSPPFTEGPVQIREGS